VTALTSDQQLVMPDYPEPADGPLDFYQFATGGLESRLVKRYASVADRTARNPLPQLNELSVRTDAPGIFQYWNGSAWVQISALCNPVGISLVAASDSTTSDTYVNLAGAGATSFSFTKLATSTRIRLQMSATFFSSVTTMGPQFGVNINSVDYDVCRLSQNLPAASVHLLATGFAYVPAGVAAGTYTVQGRWRRLVAGGTLSRDGNDWLSIEAMEVQ
jgi:hypothetical protein